MRAAVFAGFIAGVCFAGTAFALETFQVEDQTVRLPVPPGFCALPRTPEFNYVYEMQEKASDRDTLLTIIVPCASFDDVRASRLPQSFGHWIWLGTKGRYTRIFTATGRKEHSKYYDHRYRQRTNLSELAALIKADETGDASKRGAKNPHFVDRDENAIYLAGYLNLPAHPSYLDLIPFVRRQRTLAIVWAETILGQFIFILSRYQPYEGQRTYEELVAEAKALMAEAAVANAPASGGR